MLPGPTVRRRPQVAVPGAAIGPSAGRRAGSSRARSWRPADGTSALGSARRAARSGSRLPTSAIRCSAIRSAAAAGGIRRSVAVRRLAAVVSKIFAALRLGPVEVEAVQLVGDLDHPAGVHHVVGRVEDPAVGEVLLDARVGELVVGRAADDLARQRRHGGVVQRAAERAGGVDVEVAARISASVSATAVDLGCCARTGSTASSRTSVTTTSAPSSSRCPTRWRPTLPTPAMPTRRPRSVGLPHTVLGGGPHALEDAEGGQHRGVARAAVARGAAGGPAALRPTTSMSAT